MKFQKGDKVRMRHESEWAHIPGYERHEFLPKQLAPVGRGAIHKYTRVTIDFTHAALSMSVESLNKIETVTGCFGNIVATEGFNFPEDLLELVEEADDSIQAQEQQIIKEVYGKAKEI
jgi:hypothetical protein